MRDIEAIWFGHGGELARRMDALADQLEMSGTELRTEAFRVAADQIRDVLDCEHNPLPDRLPELGDPPLRRAVPGRPVLSLPPPLAEHAARRAQEPGA
jgi:hypothetical protein